jgi:hypothetical protein
LLVNNCRVHLAYNPYFSTFFFNRNNIFLLRQISQQYFSAGLSAQPNGANVALNQRCSCSTLDSPATSFTATGRDYSSGQRCQLGLDLTAATRFDRVNANGSKSSFCRSELPNSATMPITENGLVQPAA